MPSGSWSDTGDRLVIKVIDTGIGIAPDKIPDLFENFTVGDDSSTSKYGGTGLGLALSQKLCNLMGGEILVESKLGEGSCFTICMPLTSGRRKADTFVSATLVPISRSGLKMPGRCIRRARSFLSKTTRSTARC